MSKNVKQSRILTVLLTLEMSTGLPRFACSIFRSKLLAVLRYILACSRLFSFFALTAAFMYCFFLFSRNSSCSLAEKQLYKNPHSSDTAMPLKQVYHVQFIARKRSVKVQISNKDISSLHLIVSWPISSIRKRNKFLLSWHPSSKNLTAPHKCHNSNYSPLFAGRRQTPVQLTG